MAWWKDVSRPSPVEGTLDQSPGGGGMLVQVERGGGLFFGGGAGWRRVEACTVREGYLRGTSLHIRDSL